MIMTTRDRMAVCRQDELIAEVLERNNGQFTYLPVVDRDEKVIGIFDCFSDEAAGGCHHQVSTPGLE